MKRLLSLIFLLWSGVAFAQTPTPVVPGQQVCTTKSGSTVCSFIPVSTDNPLPVTGGGGGGGGTSSNFGAAFPAAGTAAGMSQGGNMVPLTGTANNLNVQCANCSGSGASAADGAVFTAGSSVLAPGGGFFQTTATANPLTNGQQGMWQMTAQRAGFVNLRNASGTEIGTSGNPVRVDPTGSTTQPVSGTVTANLGTIAGVATATNQSSQITQETAINTVTGTTTDAAATAGGTGTVSAKLRLMTTQLDNINTNVQGAIPAGTNDIGNAGSIFPIGATAVRGSATGTTAATAASLAATVSKTNFVCGISIRANATAAVTGNATLSDGTSTLNFTQWTAPAASGLGVIEELFTPCRPASGTNVAWTATSAAPGTGGVVSVSIWGYQR